MNKNTIFYLHQELNREYSHLIVNDLHRHKIDCDIFGCITCIVFHGQMLISNGIDVKPGASAKVLLSWLRFQSVVSNSCYRKLLINYSPCRISIEYRLYYVTSNSFTIILSATIFVWRISYVTPMLYWLHYLKISLKKEKRQMIFCLSMTIFHVR